MDRTRLLTGVTILNLVLLAWQLVQGQRLAAQEVAPVLRGRALEIVDDQGVVRASITRYTGGPTYSDIVVFRLHDSHGKPVVKLDAHEAGPQTPKGTGLGLLGDTDATQAFIGTDGSISKVDLKDRTGARQQLRP